MDWLNAVVQGVLLGGLYALLATGLSLVFGVMRLVNLAQGDLTVAELAAPFAVSQPAISRHLKVLEGAGLISRSRRATARLSHLEAEPLRDATEWLRRYQEFWDESYNRLDELLLALKTAGEARNHRPETSSGGTHS